MDMVIREEPEVDYEVTARLASDGFGKAPGSFKAEKLRWLYERAFSHGTTVLSACAAGQKVGQVALVHQRVRVRHAGIYEAVQLVDLFILKAYRSRDAIAELYVEVERFCEANGIRFIIGVPNPSGARVNVRYLKLSPSLKLEIRAGLGMPFGRRRGVVSRDLGRLDHAEACAIFSKFLPLQSTGLDWTAEGLAERFSDASMRYGIHSTQTLLLVSSPRVSRHLPYVLLCSFMTSSNTRVRPADVRALTAAACAFHRRPLFVYAGVNRAVPLPGLPVPDRLRPSSMQVQTRDFSAPATPVVFDRFELIDFDFA